MSCLDYLLARLLTGAIGFETTLGHRVVHGGERFAQPQFVTPDTMAELQRINRLLQNTCLPSAGDAERKKRLLVFTKGAPAYSSRAVRRKSSGKRSGRWTTNVDQGF
jgi:hypothetical protein